MLPQTFPTMGFRHLLFAFLQLHYQKMNEDSSNGELNEAFTRDEVISTLEINFFMNFCHHKY